MHVLSVYILSQKWFSSHKNAEKRTGQFYCKTIKKRIKKSIKGATLSDVSLYFVLAVTGFISLRGLTLNHCLQFQSSRWIVGNNHLVNRQWWLKKSSCHLHERNSVVGLAFFTFAATRNVIHKCFKVFKGKSNRWDVRLQNYIFMDRENVSRHVAARWLSLHSDQHTFGRGEIQDQWRLRRSRARW